MTEMVISCSECNYLTMSLGRAKEHYEKENHKHFNVMEVIASAKLDFE